MKTVVSFRKCLAVLFGLALLTVSLRAAEPFRIAVAGVTHDHLGGVVSQLKQGDIQVVGVWESDARYLHANALSGGLPEGLFFFLNIWLSSRPVPRAASM